MTCDVLIFDWNLVLLLFFLLTCMGFEQQPKLIFFSCPTVRPSSSRCIEGVRQKMFKLMLHNFLTIFVSYHDFKIGLHAYCIPYMFWQHMEQDTGQIHHYNEKKLYMGKLYKRRQCNQPYSELSISNFMHSDLCIYGLDICLKIFYHHWLFKIWEYNFTRIVLSWLLIFGIFPSF